MRSALHAPPTVMLAGGGTGGHVYPMLAVAQALERALPGVECVFVGTDRGMESRVVPAAGYRLEVMSTLPFLGGGLLGAVRGLSSVARSLPRARALLLEHSPRAVLSVGGYAAVPVALSARLFGVPLAVLEPNCRPGLANRAAGPLARRVYTAFQETSKHFFRSRVLNCGLALRPGFDPSPYDPDPASPPSLLVLGGSQGARSLNQVVADAFLDLGSGVRLTHQVGRANLESMRARYGVDGREGLSLVDYLDDMPAALRAADLVVSRAGGGAIAEICAVGRPSILVPLPGSGDHQLHNARAMERAGAALCVPSSELSSERLAAIVRELSADRERLSSMAARARAWGRPRAADRIAGDLLELCGLSPPARSDASPALEAAAVPGAAGLSGERSR